MCIVCQPCQTQEIVSHIIYKERIEYIENIVPLKKELSGKLQLF